MTCGTPTPATTRVVQIEPGPDADLDRVGAGVDQRLRAGAGGDVAADDVDPVDVVLEPGDHLQHAAEWPCAVSTMSTSTPASTSASARL